MTKIKLCGLRRIEDIGFVNELMPDYIGFVFYKKSKRYTAPENAYILRQKLKSEITPVGVFVDEKIDTILSLIKSKIIDAVQLHGNEDNDYISELRKHSDCIIIKAFKIKTQNDIELANKSLADIVLLDSGEGSGKLFDHSLINNINRQYFLAGGLTPQNVDSAIELLHPFGVDASSSLETNEFKDKDKMTAFIEAVRKADKNNEQ